MNLWEYLVGFALFFFAAFTKGMIGFGVNIISVSIMSLFVGPKAAIAIVNLPSFFNNLFLVIQRRDNTSLALVRRIWRLMASGLVGILLGSVLLILLNTDLISIGLGIMTVLFVLTERWRQNWRIPPEKEPILAPVAGFSAGLLGGVSGITGPILVAYLYSLRLEKRHFVFAISLMFLIFSGAQTISLWAYGFYTPQIALYAISYLIPLILGTIAGAKAQDKISQKLFERLVLAALLLVGLDLIRRGLHL